MFLVDTLTLQLFCIADYINEMKRSLSLKSILFIVAMFLCIAALLYAIRPLLERWGVAFDVLFWGNVIIFLSAILSFLVFGKGVITSNPHAIVRMTYGGMLIRMGICIVAAIVYAAASGGHMNKWAVLGCFVFYFIYTIAEVRLLVRMSKEQGNA